MSGPWGDCLMNPWTAAVLRRVPRGVLEGRCDQFAARMGPAGRGCLRFINGAHGVAIAADPDARYLYRARFADRSPTVGVDSGEVTVRYPRTRGCDWLGFRAERPAEVMRNARIPWSVEIHGGATRIAADLRGLRLRTIGVDGGAGRLEVTLPAPEGTVVVAIAGGASNVAILRPEDVAARLRVDGGVTHLRFDEKRIGAAGGELDLRNSDYDHVKNRYEVSIVGGANNVGVCATDRPGVEPREDRRGT